MLSRYNTNNRKDTLFSCHFLSNISASDIGIVGHIDVNYTYERFREEWQITSETTCIFQMLNGICVPKLFRPPLIMIFLAYSRHIPLYYLELGHDLLHPF